MVVKMEEGWDRVKAASYAWSHTASSMLSGTLLTIIGLMPIGFAKSAPGEYVRNLLWVVCIALLTSWIVDVTFTPYLGVKLLPNIPPIAGGYAAIYETPNYQKFRRVIVWAVSHKFVVAAAVAALFLVAVFDALFPLLGLGPKLYPDLEHMFLSNPDRAVPTIYSGKELKGISTRINNSLSGACVES